MTHRNAAALCISVLLTACQPAAPARVEAPADAEAGEVALEWAGADRAALLVPVYLNGRGPYSFVLDTGATLTCVDHTVAGDLALPEQTGRIGVGAGVGGVGQMRLVRIDSLRVGAARAEGLQACALDLTAAGEIGIDFDGLLGLNFLREFRVGLDFTRPVLTLQEP